MKWKFECNSIKRRDISLVLVSILSLTAMVAAISSAEAQT